MINPPLYRKLLQQLQRHSLQSLTVNVFDTILLNEYWPSAVRLRDLCAKQLPLLQQAFSPDLTAEEIFNLRQYAQRLVLLEYSHLRLDLWLDKLIELLSLKYWKSLTSEQNLELLASLIKTELEFTINNCRPNLPLISQLKQLKSAYPELKIYFLSRSYIPTPQLRALLDIFQVNIFDGGASLADLDSPTQTLFQQLPADFSPTRNLHLSDSRKHDLLPMRAQGSHILHYRPLRMRGLRTLIGQCYLQILNFNAIHSHRRHTPEDPWVTLGKALALKDSAFGEINQHLSLNPQIQLYADNILNLCVNRANTTQGDITHIKTIPSLTPTTVFQAFVWLLVNFSSPRWNAPELLKLLMREVNITTRSHLYNMCFSPDYIYSELAIQSFTEDEFYQTFLDEVKHAEPQYTSALQSSYNTLITNLPSLDKPLVFATVFNDNAINLFQEFARLHNLNYNLHKLSLNPSGIFTAAEAFANSPSRTPYQISQIQLGRRLAISDSPKVSLAPDIYLAKVLKPQLQSLLPTSRAVSASILHS